MRRWSSFSKLLWTLPSITELFRAPPSIANRRRCSLSTLAYLCQALPIFFERCRSMPSVAYPCRTLPSELASTSFVEIRRGPPNVVEAFPRVANCRRTLQIDSIFLALDHFQVTPVAYLNSLFLRAKGPPLVVAVAARRRRHFAWPASAFSRKLCCLDGTLDNSRNAVACQSFLWPRRWYRELTSQVGRKKNLWGKIT